MAAGLVAMGFVYSIGCGPTRYLTQVDDRAAGAVQAAKKVRADVFAPYEYTAAVAYLEKAREEGAYASYQVAISYGRRAEGLARQAVTIAEQRQTTGADGRAPGTIPAAAPEARAAGPGQ